MEKGLRTAYTPQQKKAILAPYEKRLLVQGEAGTGKTTALINRVTRMIREGIPPGKMKILVRTPNQRRRWLEGAHQGMLPPSAITTFFGLVRHEVSLFWPLLFPETNVPSPHICNIELNEYLIQKTVEHLREKKKYFLGAQCSVSTLSSEIANNLAKAALNRRPFEQIESILIEGMERPNVNRQRIIRQMQDTINVFVGNLRQFSILPFALAIEKFNQLYEKEEYAESFSQRYPYLVVDNLEEASCTEICFLRELSSRLRSITVGFDPCGGHTRVLGANPEFAQSELLPEFDVVELTHSFTSTPSYLSFARAMAHRIRGEKNENTYLPKEVKLHGHAELRSQMLLEVGEKVLGLVEEEGYKPGEIVVVGPYVDRVMELTLENILERKGVKLHSITRRGRLMDDPYLNALVTMACLCHPSWNVLPTTDAVSAALSLLLQIDAVRASLLAEKMTRSRPYDFVPCEETEMVDRIGPRYLERYRKLREWVLRYREGDSLSLDAFFQRFLVDVLLQTSEPVSHLPLCRKMVESAAEFLEGVSPLPRLGKNAEGSFLRLLTGGSRAARTNDEIEEVDTDAVTLSTPYSYLLSSRSTRVMVWTDAASKTWLSTGVQAFSNPYLFSPYWKKGQRWTRAISEEKRREQGAVLVSNLLKKCREKLLVFWSFYDSRGYEQDGELASVLENILKQEKH